jgi:hypothetical protein
MADLSTYRVIVRARNKPGTGYTYVITRLDDPAWSHGTAIYYPSPETAHEAGRVAVESFLARLAASDARARLAGDGEGEAPNEPAPRPTGWATGEGSAAGDRLGENATLEECSS